MIPFISPNRLSLMTGSYFIVQLHGWKILGQLKCVTITLTTLRPITQYAAFMGFSKVVILVDKKISTKLSNEKMMRKHENSKICAKARSV